MGKYIAKRIIGFVAVLIGVSMLSFLLIALSNTDPAEVIARRGGGQVSQDIIEQVRREMELDAPMPIRYLNWIKGLFTGDLGVSIYSYNPITHDLKTFLPVTFRLVSLALLWILLLSVPISLICVRFHNGPLDHITRGVTILGICTPPFWLGFLLLYLFAVRLSWFKVLPKPGLKGYLLPSLTLALPMACAIIRLFRSALLAELSSDYVQYAKGRGLSSSRILTHHVLRNALPPIITVFCQYFGYLIAGSAVVESVFSLKGVGSYLIGCVSSSDATATATCIVIIAGIFVTANLAGDIINRLLCPWMVRESND